jgi:sterol 3beta-glucosyltransferase
VALGKGLQRAGHQVTLATSSRFRDFVEGCGLGFGHMDDTLLAIIDTDQGRDIVENTSTLFQLAKQGIKLAKLAKPLQRVQLRETWEIAKKVLPDFIIYHPKVNAGPHIAEKLGIGCAMATPIPIFVPTAERPFFVLPDLKLGGWYNRMSYRVIPPVAGMFLKKMIRDFRNDIGLPPMDFDILKTGDGRDIPVLHAFSDAFLPRPLDWPERAHVTGYWFLESEPDWRPPEKLRAFLDAGPPPVYVGFGSMAGRSPKRLAHIVIQALQKAGVRGIIATGWGGLKPETLPDTILKIEGAPHAWLFPKVSAVVHHGGAGTTGAGLRAGKPSVIVPFFGDQPFWGTQVHRMGVGPRPIPHKRLTVGRLTAAITHAVSDPDIKQRADDMGQNIRLENGIERAVAIIEKEAK